MARRRIPIVYGQSPTMVVRIEKPYTFWNFLFDFFMVCVTGGLWLIWVIIRRIFF